MVAKLIEDGGSVEGGRGRRTMIPTSERHARIAEFTQEAPRR